MIRQWTHELFCIFLLVNLQGTVSSVQFHPKSEGLKQHKNKQTCYKYSLQCSNLTAETFVSQCLIEELNRYYNIPRYCKTFNIFESDFTSVDKTMLPNNLLNLTITNSHIKIINKEAFIKQLKMEALNLQYNEITAIDFLCSGGLQNLQELYLDYNIIRDIQDEAFKSLKKLKLLQLNNNKLQAVHRYGFKGLINLEKLYLQNNPIKTISPEAFSDLIKLIDIDLSGTDLNKLENITFLGLHSSGLLNLSNTNIQNLQPFVFNSLSNLSKLNLCGNNIEYLQNGSFDGLINLRQLYLQENPITSISPGAFLQLKSLVSIVLNSRFNRLETNIFIGLYSLVSLNLTQRNITNLPPGVFNSMSGLVELDLKSNALKTILEKSFKDLQKLELLDLTNNKISVIGPESFVGLINLQRLLLNNNLIKTTPLGTFKNFPNLYDLQIGNNLLSQFKTGTFSNLVQLKYLNLTYNNFATINETIFYPLRSLALLDLSNNNFSYINYTSLLLHLPNLSFISVNDNNWSCQLLTHMLKTFRSRRVNYLFNATEHYTEENVDGIYCTDSPIESRVIDQNSSAINISDSMNLLTNLTERILLKLDSLEKSNDHIPHNNAKDSSGKIGFSTNQQEANYMLSWSSSIKNTTSEVKQLLTNLTGRILVSLDSLKQGTDQIPHNNGNAIGSSGNIDFSRKHKNGNDNLSLSITLEELKQLLASTNRVPNYFNFYIVSLLIGIVIICVAVMFIVYKMYFEKVKYGVSSRSEIELMNASN